MCFVCGNKMPTRCNRGFYCRSYCLLNMFRASLCPSSGAQEYYTVVSVVFRAVVFQVAGLVWSRGLCVRASLCPSSGAQEYYTVVAVCGISCCGFSSSWSGVEPRVMCPVCRMLQHPANRTPLYNTLELLMMGILVPETCWASNKICNKNLCCI